MLQRMIRFFTSAFDFPGMSPVLALISVTIGVFFGAIWLIPYWPPMVKKPRLWVVGAVSAIVTWTAIAFVQIPLQGWAGQALLYFWDQITLTRWQPLASLPQVLLSGLVQEGAKLVPVVFYRWRSHSSFTPKFGLIAGAVSGAGFGVFEAIWVHNTMFSSGWTWNAAQIGGLLALLGFWERFVSLAFHIGVSAVAGYGLAKGLGWRFYLVASFLHGATNYSVILAQNGFLTNVQTEIYIAVFAAGVTAVALWLRWRSHDGTGQTQQ